MTHLFQQGARLRRKGSSSLERHATRAEGQFPGRTGPADPPPPHTQEGSTGPVTQGVCSPLLPMAHRPEASALHRLTHGPGPRPEQQGPDRQGGSRSPRGRVSTVPGAAPGHPGAGGSPLRGEGWEPSVGRPFLIGLMSRVCQHTLPPTPSWGPSPRGEGAWHSRT